MFSDGLQLELQHAQVDSLSDCLSDFPLLFLCYISCLIGISNCENGIGK